MDSSFRAIADPVRRAILEELSRRNDQTLFELCARLMTQREMSLTRQAVSKHIALLKESGVVTTTVRGRTTIHHLDPHALAEVRAWIDNLIPEQS